MGFHDLPRLLIESGKIIADSDRKRALCMPVNPVHIYAGSKGISRKILDPVKSGSLTSIISDRTGWNLARIGETAGANTAKQMELPRRKFRALMKNTILLFLIWDLGKETFTRYCKIQYAERIIVLVFVKGTFILTASDYPGGDPAMDEICTNKYSWVDAMLHDLDDAQLQLALEFNPSHRLTEDPESLSEEPEKVPNLEALHRFEGGVDPGDLYPEQGEEEQPGFYQMENAVA